MKNQLHNLVILHNVFGVFQIVGAIAIFSLFQCVGMCMEQGCFAHACPDMAARPMSAYGLRCLGTGLAVVILVFGILNLISARSIAQRRKRTFSLVMAAVDCLNLPFGAALGVYTMVVLSNEAADELYR